MYCSDEHFRFPHTPTLVLISLLTYITPFVGCCDLVDNRLLVTHLVIWSISDNDE